MNIDRDLFAKLDTYPHIVVCWIDDDGYPLQTAAEFKNAALMFVYLIALMI